MKNVLYVIEDKNSAQFRYRVENFVEAFRENKNFGVEYALKTELGGLNLEEYSLVVIARQTAKDNVLLKLIRRAHEKKLKVLFDLDDLVFDYRDLKLVFDSVREKNLFYWIGYFWGIRRIAKRVDGFLCTNEYLGRKLKRTFKKPYKVILNSLNKKQVEVAEKLIKQKSVERNVFSIGYFSGTKTHQKDFKIVEPELVKFLRDYDDTFLMVVGFMKFSKEMKKLIEKGRVKIVKKVDYLSLLDLVASVDVNIAPLVVNDFTNCKSELKFFEAAAVETTTIKDGKNGFLAQPGEWYSKLEYLYKHPEENKKIAKQAREYALKHYYGKEFLKEVEVAYDYFAK